MLSKTEVIEDEGVKCHPAKGGKQLSPCDADKCFHKFPFILLTFALLVLLLPPELLPSRCLPSLNIGNELVCLSTSKNATGSVCVQAVWSHSLSQNFWLSVLSCVVGTVDRALGLHLEDLGF